MEFFNTAAIVLGIGLCNNGLDYCPDPVGKAAIEIGIVEQERHSIMFEAVHYSEVGDGEPYGGDRGTEFYLLQYKHKLW